MVQSYVDAQSNNSILIKTNNPSNHTKSLKNISEHSSLSIYKNQDEASLCFFCHFLSGSFSGSVAKTIIYPFDRLKMIYQVKGSLNGTNFYLSNIFYDLKKIVKNEGFFKLWKGNLSTFTRTFPHSGIVFWSYDVYLEFFKENLSLKNEFMSLLSGGLAGMTSTCITYPLDVWNTRLAVSRRASRYRHVTLLAEEGSISLFRGLLPTLCGIFPYAGISFFVFETSKSYIRDTLKSDFTAYHSFIFGGLSGVVGQTVTYPIDTLRKVVQANSMLYYLKEGHNVNKNRSLIEMICCIYKNSGLRGFYNGVSLNWIKGFCAAGLSFMLNEVTKKHLIQSSICAS